MQRVTAVVLRQRFDPVERVRGQVGGGHRATIGFGVRGDFCREFTAVERLALALGDFAQRRRLIGEGEFFAGQRRAAARHEGFLEARLRFQFRHLIGPQARDGRRDHVTAFGVFDRRLEQIGKRQLAVLLGHFDPRRDAARHGY